MGPNTKTVQGNPSENQKVQEALAETTPVQLVEEARTEITTTLEGQKADTIKGGSVADSLRQDFEGIAEVSNISVPGFEGQEVVRIKVKDKEKWAEEAELRKLSKTFGEVIFHTYKDREDKTPYRADDPEFVEKAFQENMIGTDLSLSDSIIAVAKDGKLTGFMSFSDYTLENGEKADKLMLTGVHPDQEGKTDLSKKIYEIAFRNLESDYLIGSSHTPSAIKNRINTSEKSGWQTYYCGYKNGDSEAKMTEDEKKILEMAENAYKNECLEDADLKPFQEGLPPHYISYGDMGIPPRKLEELKFKPNEAALDKTMREMINYQQKERPGHTLYGLLISVRKSRIPQAKS